MKITAPDFSFFEINEDEIDKIGDVFDLFYELVETMKENKYLCLVSSTGVEISLEDLDNTVKQLRILYFDTHIKIKKGA